ncbi:MULTISPECIES: flagellar biosynthesis protein FlhB [Methylobacterium]|jgi:flagellar biosynthetic protein FlhB|uniref:flagellar biosynthesis protein FlhB n=1 Tax=Methylobacterium TaxID=407 RepID=UPI0008E35CEA|nr:MULTISPECIES: flagellar biosynthesis protein FlhB [Methylobacterium]MBZ6415296.1 flagellar biosynthesis protein FlhB [Methylobacterium sp.]MBK3396162.1 flagellar biosynthesis protein FlhB [Methylobacterium ajmalii]MBK3406796.1 flagellar biosynthesis protein FlhB [Methylobacterium ajmalii]MBK3425629.1 flagellar biosynthesis protein FlhB [Methylobacterium ajmalii]SFE80627.1 flagellar biosynthetic protein FlhB [Methylobacterium sp. yr596]
MADGTDQEDRTEDATQKRLDDAVKRGDVATSQEVNTFLMLGTFTLVLVLAGPSLARGLLVDLRGLLIHLHDVPSDPASYMAFGRRALVAAGLALAIPVGAVLAAGVIGGLVQHPLVWTTEMLGAKWSRVSPMAGLSRMFGPEAWFQFAKGLVKILLVGIAASFVLWSDRDRLEVFARLEPPALLQGTLSLCLRLMGAVLAAYVVVTVGDALYQRYRWRARHRMSKQELKDEHKEQDGNPEVKGRMRRIRAQRVRTRMMAAVPSASVIVTNPTHYAVALRYEAGMAAPVCVAKGVDALALRIREVAGEHGVPVVENPPLARALHATVEIDAAVPPEHYRAVAEVIGYVMRLRRRH